MYFDGALFMNREFEFCILSGFEFQNTVLLIIIFFFGNHLKVYKLVFISGPYRK